MKKQRGFIHPGVLAHVRGRPRPIEVLPFTINGSGGSQTVTLPGSVGKGQTPIAVMIIAVATTGNLSNGMSMSTGFSDGSTNVAYAAQSEHGVSPASFCELDTTDCIKLISSAGTDLVEASISALVSNGFTLSTGSTTGYKALAVMFFDPDGSAKVDTFSPAVSQNNSVTVTPSIATDLLLPIHAFRADLGRTFNFALQNLGFVVRGGNQVCYAFNSADDTQSNVRSRVVNNRGAALQGTIQFISWEFSGFTSTQFTCTTRDDDSDADDQIAYLALDMPNAQFHADILDTPTSIGGLSVTTPGFEAPSAIFIPTSADSENSAETDVRAECYAVAGGTDDENGVSIGNVEDAQSTSDTESRWYDTVIRSTSADGSHMVTATYDGATANGFDLSFSQVHTVAKKWPYLAAGEA